MRNEISNEDQLLMDLVQKPQVIVEVESRLKRDNLLGINIGLTEGRFLQTLVALPGVEKVVEIGTQYGCSTAYMALAVGPKGTLYSLEKDPKHFAEAQKTMGHSDIEATECQIRLICGDARDSLNDLSKDGPFDLVFIDANKSGYLDYYRWAKEFLKPGGLLVADNVYLFGSMFMDEPPEKTPRKMWETMKGLLHESFGDGAFQTSLVPTAEGLLVGTKK